MKWKHFSRYWPFVRGIHRPPVNSPHKGQWRRALMLSLICAWINGWVNNGETGDLRHHHAHYDVVVMSRSINVTPEQNINAAPQPIGKAHVQRLVRSFHHKINATMQDVAYYIPYLRHHCWIISPIACNRMSSLDDVLIWLHPDAADKNATLWTCFSFISSYEICENIICTKWKCFNISDNNETTRLLLLLLKVRHFRSNSAVYAALNLMPLQFTDWT